MLSPLQKIINLISSIIVQGSPRNIYLTGASHIALMRHNYSKIKDLNDLDYKIYSQTGEDGIIDYLLYSLKIKKPKFVEIGVGDYRESNTRFVYERASCQGMIVDITENLEKKVKGNINFWKGDLTVVEKEIDTENINEILSEKKFNQDIDLFSIDIDGIDYWILEKLPDEFSKIIVLEYNACFGDKLIISVPNIKGFQRQKYHYSHLCFGASLKAFINLLNKKGYIFLGTNLLRTNAFFVLKKYKDKINLDLPDINSLSEYVASNVRESRDKNGKLNFLAGKNRIKEIENCKVIDLSSSEKKLVKIKEIF